MVEYFKKQFPAYYFIIAILLTSMVFFMILTQREATIKKDILQNEKINEQNKANDLNNQGNSNNDNSERASGSSTQNNVTTPAVSPANTPALKSEKHVVRSGGNRFTKPILLIETLSPAEELAKLNNSLNEIINESKHNGKIQSASVYLKDMDNDNWIEVNDTEGYYPGSLMKLAVLICYLKKSEEHPEILNKLLSLEKNSIVPGQSYKDEVIKAGVQYKVSDLFYQMVVRSDNFATLLLNEELDINELNNLFSVLGLKKMDMHNIYYTITAKDYSKFMRVLYNATYLNTNNSQYALSLLTNSTFNKGLTRNLPSSTMVAHKFGENVSGKIRELHESGIVYTGTRTYLLTVMTKGERVSDLADVISDISTQTYHYFMP